LNTSVESISTKAREYDDAGKNGEKQSQDALSAALDNCEAAKVAEAEARAIYQHWIDTQVDVQRQINEATPEAKASCLKAVKAFLSGEATLDVCASQHAVASIRKNLLYDTLEHIVVVQIPAATICVKQAESVSLRARAIATYAETVEHMRQCFAAAKPLMCLNGGRIELAVNDGKTGELIRAIHWACAAADAAAVDLDAETAKHAANTAKLK